MILNETVAAIAEAIREKTGKSDLIAPVDFAEEIKSISVGGGESGGVKTTYYRYDRDNALSVFGDKNSEFTFMLYANRLCGLDIIGIQTGGNFSMFAEDVYQVVADGVRLELSYIATTPNAAFGKVKPDIAAMVTNMHDFVRLIGAEMMGLTEEQINAMVALFTEISEEEFFAAITK